MGRQPEQPVDGADLRGGCAWQGGSLLRDRQLEVGLLGSATEPDRHLPIADDGA